MDRVTKRSGFTLMEVLIVVGIVVMLAAGAAVVYKGIFAKQQEKLTLTRIDEAKRAIETFYLTMHRYPSSDKGFQELITAPEDEKEAANWVKLYEEVPQDVWGKDLQYELVEGGSSGTTFRVFSCGPDGIADTDDDLPVKPK